ncbi:MAG: cytochrome b/b6 domain-containing protein [Pseudomonadota bacterium]|nr:cytochrome b/b6 domain-containing protein [Pseudomonadota bacterium]
MSAETEKEIQVWDPAIRLFHWSLAATFAVTYLTEDDWELLHVNAGYLMGALLVFRVLWGFVGPYHARFAHFVRPPSEVMSYLWTAVRFQAPRHIGHNPAGGAMILALLISLAITVVSGIALYGSTDFAGPLAGVLRGEMAADILEGVHETGANLTLLLVVLHLGGVLFASLEHGENLIKAMFTGRKKENPA